MPNAAARKKPAAKAAKKKVIVKLGAKSGPGLAEGAPAPNFSLPATRIGTASKAALKGKPFVIYFYPKDNTSGCTAEACDFRDSMAAFNKLGVPVIGVSKDSLASHEKFAKKFGLTFPLAADEDGKVCAAFGVWIEKSMYGRKYMGIERATFLVDAKGVIRNVWHKVSVPGHVAEVKKALAAL
jgi:peroxiredoxin Q/BCP